MSATSGVRCFRLQEKATDRGSRHKAGDLVVSDGDRIVDEEIRSKQPLHRAREEFVGSEVSKRGQDEKGKSVPSGRACLGGSIPSRPPPPPC